MNELMEPLPSNRKFGLTIGVIFIIMFLFNPTKFSILGGLGLLMVFFALLAPSFLSFPNKTWMRFGDILQKITNPIIMFLLYFIVFCPIGLILNLFRQCANTKNNNVTYWKEKEKLNHSSSMKNQF